MLCSCWAVPTDATIQGLYTVAAEYRRTDPKVVSKGESSGEMAEQVLEPSIRSVVGRRTGASASVECAGEGCEQNAHGWSGKGLHWPARRRASKAGGATEYGLVGSVVGRDGEAGGDGDDAADGGRVEDLAGAREGEAGAGKGEGAVEPAMHIAGTDAVDGNDGGATTHQNCDQSCD